MMIFSPDVKREVRAFEDVNVNWIAKQMVDFGIETKKTSHQHAIAMFSTVAGAQLVASSSRCRRQFNRGMP
jgi:TetR/AcrR family transcriptional repressor of nem operon